MDNQNNEPQSVIPALADKSLRVGKILNSAWEQVKGVKWPIWVVAIVVGVAAIAIRLILDKLMGVDLKHPEFVNNIIIIPIIMNAIVAPFYAGMLMIAITRARGESPRVKTGFQYFHKWIPLGITLVVTSLIGSIPYIIVNIPGFISGSPEIKAIADLIAMILALIIYVLFLLSVPLVADKDKSPGQAISTSVKLVAPHWLKVFVAVLIPYVFVLIIIIPLILGFAFSSMLLLALGYIIFIVALIWLLPFLLMVLGTIYHRLVD